MYDTGRWPTRPSTRPSPDMDEGFRFMQQSVGGGGLDAAAIERMILGDIDRGRAQGELDQRTREKNMLSYGNPQGLAGMSFPTGMSTVGGAHWYPQSVIENINLSQRMGYGNPRASASGGGGVTASSGGGGMDSSALMGLYNTKMQAAMEAWRKNNELELQRRNAELALVQQARGQEGDRYATADQYYRRYGL